MYQIKIESLPLPIPNFNEFTAICDLVYYDGPFLTHYISPDETHFLFYWVDINDDINTWIAFPVTLSSIYSYLDKQKTLRDLFLNSIGGIAYYLDVDSEINYISQSVFSVNSAPLEVLPPENSFYPFVRMENYELLILAKQKNASMFEIGIEGGNIGHGSIPLKLMYEFLGYFKDIVKTMSSFYIRDFLRSNKNNSAVEKQLFDAVNLNVNAFKTGSFKLYLSPSVDSPQLPADPSSDSQFVGSFATEIINFLKSGTIDDFTELDYYSRTYNDKLLNKYSNFADFVSKNGVCVDITWFNETSDSIEKNTISIENSELIIQNISEFRKAEPEEFTTEGEFVSVNTNSRHFYFKTKHNRGYVGYYDKNKPKSDLKQIAFYKNYEVKIKRIRDGGKDEFILEYFKTPSVAKPLVED